MLTFNQFLSNLMESFEGQLDSVFSASRNMRKLARPTDYFARFKSPDPFDPLGHNLGGVPSRDAHFDIDPADEESGRFRSASFNPRTNEYIFQANPEKYPNSLKGIDKLEAAAQSKSRIHSEFWRDKRFDSMRAHELSHGYQWRRQVEDGSISPDDSEDMKSSGDPSRRVTTGDEMTRVLYKEIKSANPSFPSQLTINRLPELANQAQYHMYLNSDPERNARAVQHAMQVPEIYDRHYKMLSKENPEMSHQEKQHLTRSHVMWSVREMEPTLNPEKQSVIARRYAPQYAKEYHSRISRAIQRHETRNY